MYIFSKHREKSLMPFSDVVFDRTVTPTFFPYVSIKKYPQARVFAQMDAAAEIGRNPVSKHQVQPEYGHEQADAERDGRTRLVIPNSQARTRTGKYSFSLFS